MEAGRAPAVVGITADRRWQEQARLLGDRGFEVIHGPTMRTVDLAADPALRAATHDLARHPPDVLVVTTGMGMRRWLDAARAWGVDGPLLAGLARARVVARGAKSASAARAAGLAVWWRAPRETMAEITDHLSGLDLASSRVALQLFDPESHPATAQLEALAGELVELPVYRWALPHDTGPALALIDAALAGSLGAVTFTAQPAVRHLFRLAAAIGRDDGLRRALNGAIVASCVGPVCASAARDEGVTDPIWPDPPRLPAMVRQLAERLGTPAPSGAADD